jgi:hypothetical protein
MKLFQQLLLAPAAIGLLAPIAVQAADLNISGVNQYASQDQVTSINQFSDVRPTDWAYQALSNLVEKYGCVAGYPDGTYRGSRAMTRYEAAALLNACLDRVTEVTDELKRLMKEFEQELAVIRGRVDGLEARVGELEASQFSTTTKLRGVATFVLGANSFNGRTWSNEAPDNYKAAFAVTGYDGSAGIVARAESLEGAVTFNYNIDLFFDTSFTGKDLLRTKLRAGNFGQSAYSGNPPVGLNAMEIAFEENCGTGTDCGDVLSVNRLFYQFPIGANFTATVGPRVRQDDMLAFWPSAYPADTVLDIFTYAGAPGTYSLNLGGGAGLWWKNGNFSISANYVSANADVGSPDLNNFPNCGGIGNDCSASTFTSQIGWAGPVLGLAAAYTYSQGGAGIYGGNGTPLAVAGFGLADSVNSVGLSGYWQPTFGAWFPAVSYGWGINTYNGNALNSPLTSGTGYSSVVRGAQSQSWYVGMQWADVFLKGNALGMAIGQPTFITKSGDNDVASLRDGNYAWEGWYKFQVTDNISVTPAIYYLSAPLGQLTRYPGGGNFNNFGGLLKTTFRF